MIFQPRPLQMKKVMTFLDPVLTTLQLDHHKRTDSRMNLLQQVSMMINTDQLIKWRLWMVECLIS